MTPGANQAFLNLVIATLDPTDRVVLFRPYYFNHHMALQARLCCVACRFGDQAWGCCGGPPGPARPGAGHSRCPNRSTPAPVLHTTPS